MTLAELLAANAQPAQRLGAPVVVQCRAGATFSARLDLTNADAVRRQCRRVPVIRSDGRRFLVTPSEIKTK